MKTKAILFFLLFAVQLNAQNIRQTYEVKFYGGRTVEQLIANKLVNDIIESNDILLYLNIKIPNGQQEFFRYDDSTFVFREKINERITENGNVVFKKIQPPIIDTIILIDPEGIADDTTIVSYCHLVKEGHWKEMNEKGELWQGAYFKNRKYGRWVALNAKVTKVLDYGAGEIIQPLSKDSLVIQFLDFLTDKNWACCVNEIFGPDGTILESEWDLQTVRKQKCYEVGSFTFQENGAFIFKEIVEKPTVNNNDTSEYENESIPSFRFGGTGKWKIMDDGKLQLEFFNKKVDLLKIKFVDKEKVILELVN